ncbi:uncharacterized protein OCT59_004512 [Rhizophagus irregularis]|uniref:uncharacterized protein n=1 Tax=Rhizophagus irregularis TaxID=588596 RepID=UPI003325CDEB|nr:hypothetical protein OCT59_004512 [Rhizophagus irregularis]
MDELKLLSDDVFEQIKDFDLYYHLSEEQKSLIDQLIPNEELKERYQYYGLCKECKQPNTGCSNYCQSCNSKRFQQNFKNWTSGNHEVDKLIQKTQLNAEYPYKIMEWIEYDKFKDVEYLAKGGFGTVFKAIWKDGFINKWDYENDQWEREAETKVALKSLHNSQDITTQFLKEIEAHNSSCSSVGWIVRCFGITKDPETENFMMIMELKEGSLRQHLNNNFISMDWVQKFCNLYDPLKRPDVNKLYELLWNLFNYAYNTFDPAIDKQIKEVEKINKESTYLSTSSPLLSNGTFSYMTHPQAIYTSKLLDFKNLPEPKNTNNNEDLLGSEYSESMSFDFSKLDINSKDENN